MKIFPAVGDYFALDIGTTAIRAIQLSGSHNAWTLERYGIAPVDLRVSTSDAAEDQRKLAEIITTVIGQSGIRSRNVILGIPSNKMFATVIDMPDMPKEELANTIKYQAEQYIPMSIDEAKIDWTVIGKSINDPTKNEILLASVANSFSESRLDLVEGLGLNVLAIEPDSLGLVRSLLPAGVADGRLIVEIGDFATDIVMTCGDNPRLIRSIPTGFQTLVKAATQNLNVQPNQAQQFIMKFGLQPDKLEGQVLRAMEATLEQFVSEIDKSVKFFKTRYPSVNVSGMIVSSYGVTIPGLSHYLGEKVGLTAEIGNPWQRVRVSTADQTKLQPMSAQFAVAIGLAQRGASS
ncbi:MAG TPA: type IV pilus assembly protein PilM [Candidatus Saccharimonadales bacterium]|nr:type IV pilus assembly protein PilM [Candidatus Saccharimonadales bacterium]